MQHRLITNSTPYESDLVPGFPDCWIWMLTCRRNKRGVPYPSMTVFDPTAKKNKNKFAHRESLKAFKGVVFKKGEVDMHLCNNTLCIHPDHLTGGTQSENMLQCVADGRHNSQRKKQ